MDIIEELKTDPSPKGSLSCYCGGIYNDLNLFEKYIMKLGSPVIITNMKSYHRAKTYTQLRGMEEKSGFGKIFIIMLLIVALLGLLLIFGPKLMQMMSGTGGF